MKKEITKTKKQGGGNERQVILRPYISEKSQRVTAANQYSFLVEPEANKILVKREVEAVYGVHVRSVTMTILKTKPRHYRGKVKYFRNRKKATVRVAAGEKIDIS